MILYHASKQQFAKLERQQAAMEDGVAVPAAELQNKIYATPSLGFALAMAAGPQGMTAVVGDTISFEHADAFDPEVPVYVYEIDSAGIAPELIETIDADQVAIDLDKLTPAAVHVYKAKDVFDHYRLVDWAYSEKTKWPYGCNRGRLRGWVRMSV